jgi:hypothetical protein
MKACYRLATTVTGAASYRLFWLFWLAIHGIAVAVLLGGGCGK